MYVYIKIYIQLKTTLQSGLEWLFCGKEPLFCGKEPLVGAYVRACSTLQSGLELYVEK